MRTQLKAFWGLLLLVSIVWMAAGTFVTSDAFENGAIGEDIAEGVESLASGVEIDLPQGYPLPLLFLVSGLPVAALSLFFFWRSGRHVTASANGASAVNIRRQTIAVTALALIVALLIWNMNEVDNALRQAGQQSAGLNLTAVTYPIRLFVTYVHEAGHSLAALLTGGQVQGFTVSPDGSGYAVTAGGNPALILPAGYLGAALFGSLLFFLTNRIPRWTRGLSLLIGLSIIALTLSYAMPDQAGNATALIVGIGYGVAFLLLGWQAPRLVNVFVLNTLAILTGLNAAFDLRQLIQFAGSGTGRVVDDAAAFSRDITPLIPASIIAAIWAAIAVGMLGGAVYFGLLKQVGGEISDTVKDKNAA